ncbi:Hypothetical predicted protein [Mytilus galloprovincialis]|uniref:Uncharacterized protein n=1 Tax=Mytilus galloprovincialis TaxID=29158 RepID=A0A8B6CES7_MYTGA|nr:Hypothetical predicted protein [Mytilus galloprovincialis]
MPMVFRTEEVANSRGQGLRPAKTGDIRLPLDVDKIKTVKGYVNTLMRSIKKIVDVTTIRNTSEEPMPTLRPLFGKLQLIKI